MSTEHKWKELTKPKQLEMCNMYNMIYRKPASFSQTFLDHWEAPWRPLSLILHPNKGTFPEQVLAQLEQRRNGRNSQMLQRETHKKRTDSVYFL